MMNLKKINEILGKILEASEAIRFEVTIGNGVETPFGIKVTADESGRFLEVKLYYECENPGDILGSTQELIYRGFVIGPDRTLYRFACGDGNVSYYKPGGFGGFTSVESMYIVNIMNYVEGGDN